MANTVAIIMAASFTSPTNCHVVTAQHEQYKKPNNNNEKYWRIYLKKKMRKKIRRKGQQQRKYKTERAAGLDR